MMRRRTGAHLNQNLTLSPENSSSICFLLLPSVEVLGAAGPDVLLFIRVLQLLQGSRVVPGPDWIYKTPVCSGSHPRRTRPEKPPQGGAGTSPGGILISSGGAAICSEPLNRHMKRLSVWSHCLVTNQRSWPTAESSPAPPHRSIWWQTQLYCVYEVIHAHHSSSDVSG